MPGNISDTYKVRIRDAIESPAAELEYIVTGTEDENDVYNLVQTVLQPNYYNYFLTDYTFEHVGAGTWTVKVNYGGTLPQEDGTVAYQLDTTGGTDRLRQSFETTAYDVSGYTGPPDGTDVIDYGGAINVRGVDVEGVEVVVPALELSIVKYFSLGNMPPNHLQDIYDLTGCVNDAEITVYLNDSQPVTAGIGNVLFRGAVVSQKGVENYAITYKLSLKQAREYTIGKIPPFTKAGHQFVWVRYQPAASTSTTPGILPAPLTAYVEQVYPEDDLGLLLL